MPAKLTVGEREFIRRDRSERTQHRGGAPNRAAPIALRTSILAGCVAALLPLAAQAQLEEILVTAQRRETNLQQTPISIQAFTGEALEMRGIEQGRDLGIMVPNVVLNPAGGGGPGGGSFYIRGLPGVGIYVDGVWQGNSGFLESDFVELERVEVLRGPQGTLFGRNTNGGAVNITTRRPADDFGARGSFKVGEFNRRDATVSVDLPFSDKWKSKWTGARYSNDGYLDSVTVPRSFGGQDDTVFRGDVMWEPTDNFSLRLTLTDENKNSSDARIVRISNTQHARYLAYNVLAGNPDFLAAARAVDPTFPDPPKQLAFNRFTAETHQPGFPGGQLGKWQTRSNTADAGTRRDLQYATATLDWSVTDHFRIESISSGWDMDQRQVTDFDGSEFTITTDDYRTRQKNFTEEIHFTGDNLDGKINWLAGIYYLRQKNLQRFYRWGMWEFAVPNRGPLDPAQDLAARDYVRAFGRIMDASPLCYRPRPLPPGSPPDPESCLQNFAALTSITDDALTGDDDEDTAFFGEATFSVTPKLDLTLGVRVTADDGEARTYIETGGFRSSDDQLPINGDPFSGIVETVTPDPDLGNITTNKFAVSYKFTDDVMVYGSWGEGFTAGGVTISPNFPEPIVLDPEVISTREVGLRSDWLDGHLRFNASYFFSNWDGLRVPILPDDPNNPGQKLPFPVNTSEGLAEAEGWEFEIVWAPTENHVINGGLGLLDSRYLDIGDPDPTGINGIQPGAPFSYAPKHSASVSVQYNQELRNGGHLTYIGNYGWMDEYVRDSANQRLIRDASGNIEFEPAYGIFNARLRYEPAAANWNVELWGRNLADVQYVNGGFDTHTVWGFDFSVVGPSRELGVTLGFTF
jgi:iron complex outermembrane receptor protein